MISLILVCLAGIFKAAMDLSAHDKTFWFMGAAKLDSPNNPSAKKYDWWYMTRSAGFKWKNGKDKTDGEKFFGSSSFAVALVDGWHLFQFFFLNLMIAAMVCYKPIVNGWVDFIILAVVLKGTFQVNYKYILIKKEQK